MASVLVGLIVTMMDNSPVAPTPEFGWLSLVAALAFAGDRSPARSRETIGLLQELVHRELRSDLDDVDANSPKDQPPHILRRNSQPTAESIIA